MNEALNEIVELGGWALQAEDAVLRAALRARGKRGGLTHAKSERYHQFVVWRALLPRWNATFELDRATDIVAERDGVRHHIEMKNWRDPENHQIGAIQRDIARLGPRTSGFIVVTSLNPRGQMAENLENLVSRLNGLAQEPPASFRFDTEEKDGNDLEFWIAGWRVLPTA